MKRHLPKTKRQVAMAVVSSYPGGRQAAAARLGLPLKKFDNHLYENPGSRPLSDDKIRLLEKDAGTSHLPEYVTHLYGGLFVPLPEPQTLDNIELYERSVKVSAKRGAVDQAIADALDDGVIQPGEADTILKAHRHYLSARHAEVLATLQLHSK